MTLYAAFNWVCNYPLYIWVIATMGMGWGGLVMFSFSLVQNIGLLFLYDKMKIDWVGAGYLESIRRPNREKTWTERLLTWAITEEAQTRGHRFMQALMFVVLSIFVDPFIVSVHYRRSQFSGVSGRDLWIITTSVIVGNVYWTLRTGALVGIAKVVWNWF